MDAALGELSAERSGVGSALIMALRQVGGTFGVALLGSAMNAAYRSQLDLSGVPEPAAETVRQGVAAGTAVAKRLNSEPLLDSVRHAFVSGMDIMLLICGFIAVVGMALALLYLPRTAGERSAGSANEFGA
jgi:hypothetical protein